MPTKNRIRVLLAENHETAKSIVPMLPDVDRVAMSYIVQGRVLPTKDTLNAMTAVLNCKTIDIYSDLREIDLADGLQRASSDSLANQPKITSDHGHDGMERVYIWYPQGGKEALFEVIKQLDYPSVAEWFRDMARITFLKAAKLDGQTLHEAAIDYDRILSDFGDGPDRANVAYFGIDTQRFMAAARSSADPVVIAFVKEIDRCMKRQAMKGENHETPND
jgi:hypothetical protein